MSFYNSPLAVLSYRTPYGTPFFPEVDGIFKKQFMWDLRMEFRRWQLVRGSAQVARLDALQKEREDAIQVQGRTDEDEEEEEEHPVDSSNPEVPTTFKNSAFEQPGSTGFGVGGIGYPAGPESVAAELEDVEMVDAWTLDDDDDEDEDDAMVDTPIPSPIAQVTPPLDCNIPIIVITEASVDYGYDIGGDGYPVSVGPVVTQVKPLPKTIDIRFNSTTPREPFSATVDIANVSFTPIPVAIPQGKSRWVKYGFSWATDSHQRSTIGEDLERRMQAYKYVPSKRRKLTHTYDSDDKENLQPQGTQHLAKEKTPSAGRARKEPNKWLNMVESIKASPQLKSALKTTKSPSGVPKNVVWGANTEETIQSIDERLSKTAPKTRPVDENRDRPTVKDKNSKHDFNTTTTRLERLQQLISQVFFF